MYDEKMLLHEDHFGKHPERPARIQSIHDYLKDIELLNEMKLLDTVESTINVSSCGTSSYPVIETVHEPKTIELIQKNIKHLGEGETKKVEKYSVYYNKHTLDAAKFASDSVLTAVCEVLDDESPRNRGFCIVRPPGHHAHSDHHAGFCFFNHVALGA